MTGLTTGPRQFNMQAPPAIVIEGGATPTGWIEEDDVFWYESKLDLRAFNMKGGIGLDLLNVALQEGGPWSAAEGQSEEKPSAMVLDVFSSVRLDPQAIVEAISDFRSQNFMGFTSTTLKANTTTYNPSQIIWGMWRAFAVNVNLSTVFDRAAVVAYQSGLFGQGEVIVAPNMYYYKIVKSYAGDSIFYVPATIAVCHGVLVEMTQGQELSQMARLSQR